MAEKAKRKSPKETKIYQKEILVKLTSSDKTALQDVAHTIHSINHPALVGGAKKRTVQMTHTSTEPSLVFAGRIA